MYEVGTIGSILQLLKLPDGTVKVLVEGLSVRRSCLYTDRADFFEAKAASIEGADADGGETEALARTPSPSSRAM